MKKCEGLTCQESLTDMLTVEKNLVKLYATALTEMASEANRSLIKRNLTDVADGQNLIFCEMQKQGFYKTTPAPKEKLLEAQEQFCQNC